MNITVCDMCEDEEALLRCEWCGCDVCEFATCRHRITDKSGKRLNVCSACFDDTEEGPTLPTESEGGNG